MQRLTVPLPGDLYTHNGWQFAKWKGKPTPVLEVYNAEDATDVYDAFHAYFSDDEMMGIWYYDQVNHFYVRFPYVSSAILSFYDRMGKVSPEV